MIGPLNSPAAAAGARVGEDRSLGRREQLPPRSEVLSGRCAAREARPLLAPRELDLLLLDAALFAASARERSSLERWMDGAASIAATTAATAATTIATFAGRPSRRQT